MREYGFIAAIRAFAAAGGAIYGSCAGLIALASRIVEGDQPLLGLIDIAARRNAFGRQVRSFEADLDVPAIGPEPMRAVFIRAPWIEDAGAGVEILATCQGHGVAAREGNVLVTAFHPELTGDTRVHEPSSPDRGERGAEPEGAAQPRAAGEPGRACPAPSSERRWSSCPGTPSGRASSTRRARQTPSAASSSPSWRGRSWSPPKRADPTPTMNTNLGNAIEKASRLHAQGQYRAGDPARRRRGERRVIRDHHLRGVRAQRRRHHRRGAHRQQEPHRRRGAQHLLQARRLAGAAGRRGLDFERRGSIVVDGTKYSEDDVMAAAIEAGAEDVVHGR